MSDNGPCCDANPRRRVRLPVAPALLAAVLVLSACVGSGGDQGLSDAVPTESRESSTGTGSTATSASSGSSDETLGSIAPTTTLVENESAGFSPLMQFLGVPTDPLVQRAAMIKLDVQRQELIAECMAEEGWTYYPFSDMAETFEYWDQQAAAGTEEMSDGEFNPHGGYGVAIGYDGELENEGDVRVVNDPNAAIFEAFDDTEFQEYAREHNACREVAQIALEGGSLLGPVFALPDELADPLAAIDEQVRTDPRYADARDGWAECMSEQGFHYVNRDEIMADLGERMAPIYAVAPDPGDVISDDLIPLFDEIRNLEQDIADRDAVCTQPIADLERALRWEYEAAFVEEYGDLLALVKAEIAVDRGSPSD